MVLVLILDPWLTMVIASNLCLTHLVTTEIFGSLVALMLDLLSIDLITSALTVKLKKIVKMNDIIALMMVSF